MAISTSTLWEKSGKKMVKTNYSAGPEVSIIMPVRNEAVSLDATLASACSQATDASIEVIIVDDHSTDSSRSIIERWVAQDERVRLLSNPRRGVPQALNRGLEAARGRYLIRVDGHSIIPPDYVQALLDHLRSGACEGAGGRKHAVGQGPFGRAVAAAHGSRFGIGNSKYHYSQRLELVDHIPFGAYVTERARAIGGWDEELRTNEDYDFDFRYQQAGGRLLYDPSIVFEWRVRETPARLAQQYYAYGHGKFRALARHRSPLHLRWLVPPMLVGSLAAGILLSWTTPGRVFLAVVGGSYALFLVVGAATLGSRVGMRVAPHAALALGTMHLCWGTGFLVSVGKAALGRHPGFRRLRA
jgi:succinoglycan biosynthesis protein ExoA